MSLGLGRLGGRGGVLGLFIKDCGFGSVKFLIKSISEFFRVFLGRIFEEFY